MRCDSKIQLFQEYQKATAFFSAAVSELKRTNGPYGIVSLSEYLRLRSAAETCRQYSVDARGHLERHIGEHGC